MSGVFCFTAYLFSPGGQLGINYIFAFPGKGEPEGIEQRGFFCISGAVFVVADQGEAAVGKLYPDLMGPPGEKLYADERQFACSAPKKN